MYEKIITIGKYQYKIKYSRHQENDIMSAWILSNEHDFFQSISFFVDKEKPDFDGTKRRINHMIDLCKKHEEKIRINQELENILIGHGFKFNERV
jgi:hypothetical protein